MLKQVWVCDSCGKEEKAKTEKVVITKKEPTLPNGWKCGYNKDFHICDECALKLAEIDVDEGEPNFIDNFRHYSGCTYSHVCHKRKEYGYRVCNMDCGNWNPRGISPVTDENERGVNNA